MLRIAIVDDEKYSLEKIQEYVVREFEKYNFQCSYDQYTSAKEFIEAYKIEPYDIVFLDIIMPEYTGFQVATEMRYFQTQTYLIFVTANDESVYDSFDFQPFQFVRKGCDDIFENRMKYIVRSLVRHMKQNQTKIFQLPFSEKKRVKISDMVAIKSDHNYIEIHLLDNSVLRVRYKLSEIEKELLSYDFIRVHNCWLVNMRHIRQPDYPNEEIGMVNYLNVPLSRSHKNELHQRYAEYLRSTQ